ncbi:MAG: tRNA 4-thiouridine(8) synthase ThiI [Victivallales bacterium]|nr:tRNA 4-thiouridine(8) synthase ThiI [Victivallales bacterium]MBR6058081.1 tRNA 4-thiouridine(8) synthase ThiI [Victivallales bacterium]
MIWQPFLPYNALIVRFNEIGTKGRNRLAFEEALGASLQRVLSSVGKLKVINEHGRLFLLPEYKPSFTAEDIQLMRDTLPMVPGLSSLSPGFYIEPTLEAIEQIMDRWFDTVYLAFVSQSPCPPKTYAMRARRADKKFPMNTDELERHFAKTIIAAHPDLSIDLKNANLLVEVEIRYHQAFVSFERIYGAGGLPVGTAGNVLALLSGGIDSPVACFQMMRRGCSVDYVTFHSEPYTPPEYISKIVSIARQLNNYQQRGRLVAVNLLAAQKEIRDKCRSRYRTILYRRFMLRIANQLARLFGSKAIVTGENLGQVASQTLDNMGVIEQASDLIILRPLLTFEKLETVAIAEKIRTFDLSAQNIPDSCTVFAPDDPATFSKLNFILFEEKALDVEGLVRQCLESAIIINPDTDTRHPLKDLPVGDRTFSL